jgi:hypothetical protein
MEIKKPNDIFVAAFNNPNATTYDLMSTGINPDNTSLYSKDEYKETKFVKDRFKKDNGDFDEQAFDNFYKLAQYHYQQMGDDIYIDQLEEIQYSPFDVTRPSGSKTYKVDIEYSKE